MFYNMCAKFQPNWFSTLPTKRVVSSEPKASNFQFLVNLFWRFLERYAKKSKKYPTQICFTICVQNFSQIGSVLCPQKGLLVLSPKRQISNFWLICFGDFWKDTQKNRKSTRPKYVLQYVCKISAKLVQYSAHKKGC